MILCVLYVSVVNWLLNWPTESEIIMKIVINFFLKYFVISKIIVLLHPQKAVALYYRDYKTEERRNLKESDNYRFRPASSSIAGYPFERFVLDTTFLAFSQQASPNK